MVWQVPGHNELSGWYHGLDGFLGFMGPRGRAVRRQLQNGDHRGPRDRRLVVRHHRNKGKRADSDKTMDIEVAHVLRWRDGKVIAGRGAIFGDGTTEYDQFWSRAPVVGDTR